MDSLLSNEGLGRTWCRKAEHGRDLTLSDLSGALHEEAAHSRLDPRPVEGISLGIDDKHARSAGQRNLPFWKNRAFFRDKLWPDHADAVFEGIVTFVHEVPSDVLLRQVNSSAFVLSEEAVVHFKGWRPSSTL